LRRFIAILFLTLVFAGPAFAGSGAIQTTLYFGMDMGGGKHVGEKQWRNFLADTVTPRFPDGFTVLAGSGQWRDPKDKSGKINSEATKIVIIIHADTPASAKAVAEVKSAYLKRFHQQSVLQTDQPVHIVE
jgi:hypothetical protein